MNIGKQIELFRKVKNIKQKELAEKVNKSSYYIREIEKNRKFPSIALLMYIAHELEC